MTAVIDPANGGAVVVVAGGALVVAPGGAVLVDVEASPWLLRTGTSSCRASWGEPPQAAPTSGSAARPTAATMRTRTTCHSTGDRTAHRIAGMSGVVLLVVMLGGCGTTALAAHGAAKGMAQSHPRNAPTTTAPTAAVPPAPSTTVPTAAATTTVAPPSDVAGQRVVVDATSADATTAELTAYQRTSAGWRAVLGPWTAHVGYNGFAAPGAKREGDGRTPSGTFSFGFAFGVDPDPGVHLAYRPVTGPNIVWDDDPGSPHYNEWVDSNTANPGANPEPMDNTPAYDYGVVIDYNTAPVVPGAGSAIFLHVSTGGSTAGCVSLPMDELLAVLRWLDPAQGPTIVMGVGASTG